MATMIVLEMHQRLQGVKYCTAAAAKCRPSIYEKRYADEKLVKTAK